MHRCALKTQLLWEVGERAGAVTVCAPGARAQVSCPYHHRAAANSRRAQTMGRPDSLTHSLTHSLFTHGDMEHAWKSSQVYT